MNDFLQKNQKVISIVMAIIGFMWLLTYILIARPDVSCKKSTKIEPPGPTKLSQPLPCFLVWFFYFSSPVAFTVHV